MNFDLKKLTIINFKGIKNLVIDFGHVTTIKGDNATCKTTIADAFHWLLTGKNSHDEKDFGIKPLNEDGSTVQKTDSEVTAIAMIDGATTEIKKTHREKWVKKQGEAVSSFTGNETIYFWNEVPLKLSEYQRKINDLLDEKVFKLLTSPIYFNSMPWQSRRSALIAMTDEVSNELIISKIVGNHDANEITNLRAILNSKTSLDEHKRSIGSKKKRIKDELDFIPTRIDEIMRTLPPEEDWEFINAQISEKKNAVVLIDEQWTEESKSQVSRGAALLSKQKEVNAIKLDINQVESRIKNSVQGLRIDRENNISNLKRTLRQTSDELLSIGKEMTSNTFNRENISRRLDQLRSEWHLVNEQNFSFDEETCTCPTCKQKLPADDIESQRKTLQGNFNNDKTKKLTANREQGVALNTDRTALDEKISQGNLDIASLKEKISLLETQISDAEQLHQSLNGDEQLQLNDALAKSDEIKEFNRRIAALESDINALPQVTTNMELKNKKFILGNEIEELQKRLNVKKQREISIARKEELFASEEKLSQELASLESTEFAIQGFERTKMDTITEQINSMFRYVSFKMFNTLINGGTEETCECTSKGVPYSDLNTAAKINAGIDIINVFADFYKVHAPIFIDNRESVVKLIPCQSQIVNLVVVEGLKTLRIEKEESSMAMA